jgi:hypothetical protein
MAFQWFTQFLAAAMRPAGGAVEITGFGTLQIVAFWLFPVVLGSVALVVWSLRDEGFRETAGEGLRRSVSGFSSRRLFVLVLRHGSTRS